MSSYLEDVLGQLNPKDARALQGRVMRRCMDELASSPDVALCVIPVLMQQGMTSSIKGILYVTQRQVVFVSIRGDRLAADIASVNHTRTSMRGIIHQRPEYLHLDIGGSGEITFVVLSLAEESLSLFLTYLERLRDQAARSQTAGGGSAADELAKYAALRDQGVLSEEEFAQKKAQLLGG